MVPVILVTGSSGLIGHAVSDALDREGHRVLGFDLPGAPHPPDRVENVPCDLTSDASVATAFAHVRREAGERIAAVVHLAAYYDFSGEPSPQYEAVTVRGTERLLHALAGFAVEQFLYSSTMLVHAPCEPGEHIDEDWQLEPKWDYPRSKLRAERFVLAQRGEMPAVLLRIAGVYTDRCDSIPLAHQIQRIFERRLTSRVFPGDVSRGQSFVHLDDVVSAVRAAIARRGGLPPATTILVGEPEPPSYDVLQRTLALLIHGDTDWDTHAIPKAVAKAGAWVQDKIPGVEEPFIKPWMIDLADDHYALDIERARALLGWWPRRDLLETLPRMVATLRADPARWYQAHELTGTPPG